MKALRPWIGIALLAPMLVLAVSASSFFGLRCRMSGMVSLDSCCPDTDPVDAPVRSSMGEPGCCERIVVETAKPAADTASDGDRVLRTPMLVMAPAHVAIAFLLPRVVSVVAEGDPPRASPV